MDSSLSSFEITSMIRGYHEYKAIWEDPINGESLVCEREVGNSHDPLSVAVKKTISGASTIVGHVPWRISLLCSVFLRRGGSINCTVNGHRRYSEDLSQGGLEILCRLIFTSTKPECSKLQKLICSSLAVTMVEPQVQVKIT